MGDMVDTTVTDMADTGALTDMEDTTTARGPLMPNQRPQLWQHLKPHPKPRLTWELPLMPTTDTTAVDTDTVTDTDTVLDTAVTTVMVVFMADTVVDTDTVTHTDTDTTTARGLLMLNPLLKPHLRLMLMPLLTMVDTMAVDTVMVDTVVLTDTAVDTMAVDTVMVDTAVDTDTVMANRFLN